MLVHWIWLAHRPGISDRMKAELLRHFSDPEDIYFADEEAFAHIDGLAAENVRSLRDKDLASSEKILADVMQYKLHILTYRDVAYPARLKAIADPPLILYYKGTLPDFDNNPVIGVVGTRKCTPYGLSAAKKLGCEIAKCGGILVSGLAEGIDTMAMKSALSAGGTVVGILGCGAEQIYPRKNHWLFADVERYMGKCRFSDCKHESEPGCAIKAAIAIGELDIARWESYQKLKEEAVDRDEMLRRKQAWSKGVAKFTRQRNKEIW